MCHWVFKPALWFCFSLCLPVLSYDSCYSSGPLGPWCCHYNTFFPLHADLLLGGSTNWSCDPAEDILSGSGKEFSGKYCEDTRPDSLCLCFSYCCQLILGLGACILASEFSIRAIWAQALLLTGLFWVWKKMHTYHHEQWRNLSPEFIPLYLKG